MKKLGIAVRSRFSQLKLVLTTSRKVRTLCSETLKEAEENTHGL